MALVVVSSRFSWKTWALMSLLDSNLNIHYLRIMKALAKTFMDHKVSDINIPKI